MATAKLVLGLGMTVVLLGIAGARLLFLYRVGASPSRSSRAGSARPATWPAPRWSRSPVSESCCGGPHPGWRTSPSSGASRSWS